MSLTFEDVVKNYDNGPVLEGVDVNLEDGEIMLLTGGNGSGKTTLLHVAAGLRAPDSGTVRVGGEEIRKFGESRRNTRLLPQEFSFHPRSTPADHIHFYRQIHGGTPRIEDPLAEVGLSEKRAEPIQSLSGGMIQRLGLAVTFLFDAPVFLLDEPTNNLDPDWRDYLVREVKSARERDRAIIVSSQTPGLWRDISDKHWHMEGGKLHEPEGVLSYSRGT